jgi:hypothetical protein
MAEAVEAELPVVTALATAAPFGGIVFAQNSIVAEEGEKYGSPLLDIKTFLPPPAPRSFLSRGRYFFFFAPSLPFSHFLSIIAKLLPPSNQIMISWQPPPSFLLSFFSFRDCPLLDPNRQQTKRT